MDPFYNELSYLVRNEYLPYTLSLQSIGKKGMRSLTLFFCITKGEQKMRVIYILLPSSLIMCENQRKEPLLLVSFLRELCLFFFFSLLGPQLSAVVFTFCLKRSIKVSAGFLREAGVVYYILYYKRNRQKPQAVSLFRHLLNTQNPMVVLSLVQAVNPSR